MIIGERLATGAECIGAVAPVNRRWLATVPGLVLAGCVSGQTSPATVEVLEQGPHCGQSVAAVAWERVGDDGLRLRLSMGRQRTGGYVLALGDPEVEFVDGSWELHVDWREPGPDELVTQALTTPCLLLAVPWDEPVTLRVLDQHGRERLVGSGGTTGQRAEAAGLVVADSGCC